MHGEPMKLSHFFFFIVAAVTLSSISVKIACALEPEEEEIIVAALEEGGFERLDFTEKIPALYTELNGTDLCLDLNPEWLRVILASPNYVSFWESARDEFERSGIDAIEAISDFICSSSPIPTPTTAPPTCP